MSSDFVLARIAGVAFILASVAASGCAERIGPPPNDNPDAPLAPDGSDADATQPAGPVQTTLNADGSSTSIIDASSMTAWTHVDVEFRASEETGAWALRFQRFHISTNDGTEVAPLSQPFESVTTLPTNGWLHDQDTDGNGTIEFAFDQGDTWYDYNPETHILTPKPLTWVVRAPPATFKLRLESYYDTAGTAGWLTVTWRHL